ncbi:hypothetical protein [Phenylobacterium sp.]|uniref:hypothetical protein n=1 Tax=Phenylobacterium sp. TaxID=1871053 RepID=UPI002FC9B44F
MSGSLTELVSRCALAAAAGSAPVEEISAAIRSFMQDPDPAAVAQDEEEVCLYRSDRLTLMSIRQTPNVLFPPHDHAMVAIIGTYEGEEIAKRFRAAPTGVVELDEISIKSGDVATFSSDAIHAVANVGEGYSRAIHAYLGDLVTTPRSIWDPETGEKHPYSDETYFRLARPYDPSKPFSRPNTSFAHSDQSGH